MQQKFLGIDFWEDFHGIRALSSPLDPAQNFDEHPKLQKILKKNGFIFSAQCIYPLQDFYLPYTSSKEFLDKILTISICNFIILSFLKFYVSQDAKDVYFSILIHIRGERFIYRVFIKASLNFTNFFQLMNIILISLLTLWQIVTFTIRLYWRPIGI